MARLPAVDIRDRRQGQEGACLPGLRVDRILCTGGFLKEGLRTLWLRFLLR